MDKLDSKIKIIHIAEDEKAISYKWEKESNRLNGVQIVSIDEIDQILKESNCTIIGNLQVGSTLMRHPFISDRYIDINRAEDIIFKDKMDAVASIARLLGAYYFEAEAEFVEEESVSIDLKGQINYKYVELKGSYRKQKDIKYRQTYHRKDEFEGNKILYNEAEQEAERYGLKNDSDIVSLLDARNPNSSNRLAHKEVSIQLSREYNTSLDCALSLNILSGVFSLDGDFKETVSTRKKIILKTTLDFTGNH